MRGRRGAVWAPLCAMLLALAASSSGAAAQGAVVEPLQVVQRSYMLPVSQPQGKRMGPLDAASVQWDGAAQSKAAASSAEPELTAFNSVASAAAAQAIAELPSTLSDAGACRGRVGRAALGAGCESEP